LTKVTTINHSSSNPKFTYVVSKEVTKPHCALLPQIKQCQVATTINPHYATNNESLQLQVKNVQ
jgi:hypothetical protein